MTTPSKTAEAVELEEALRLAEIGEYLYETKAFSAGNGYDEPREYSISWDWQQSKPNEYGQGVLLAEAVAWHHERAEDGIETEATKLRKALTHAQQSDARVRGALKTAVEHLEHMAAWISSGSEAHPGYSFEALGEDMPGIKAALASLTAPKPEDEALMRQVLPPIAHGWAEEHGKALAALLAAAREEGYKAGWNDREDDLLAGIERISPPREEPRQPPEDVREKVARLIDPKAWDTFDRVLEAIKQAGLNPDDEPGRWMSVEPSLAKADAILALPAVAVGDAQSQDKEGEADGR